MPQSSGLTQAVGPLTVRSDRPEPRLALVAAAGEIDLGTYRLWESVLTEALAEPTPQYLVADMAGVSFLGSCGIATLVHLHNEADAAGAEFRVAGLTRPVARGLEATGLNAVLRLYDTAEAAAR